MASAVSCRVMFLTRWYDVSTRVFTASSALVTSRNFQNETWCKRWWQLSQRNISITARSFEPNLSTILMKSNTQASTIKKDTREKTSTTSITEPTAIRFSN
ncbi:PREDICTED: uncharacterized protein LOC107069581 [Polistes dominula]|uniref:Uncharacterized protein LOC107069581 n=1 Tax=Polistes dominula TaxID=743375 RepID=A0ABM1IQM4_POLDO|nr:PREDICTED: uncharacterized protein LOC107069581 [Polistes dominula]